MRDLITAYASAIAFYIVMIFSSLGTALHGQGSEAIASITQPPASFTRKQKKVFLDLVGKETNRAMAIGPRKQWGRAWGKSSESSAIESALKYCNEFVRVGEELCQIVLLNDEVQRFNASYGKVATEKYKAFRRDHAVSYFGVRKINFQGNLAVAKSEYEKLLKNAEALATMKEDLKLRGFLENASFIRNNKFAIFFGQEETGRRYRANSGYLETRARGWKILNSGLLCWFGETWVSTGKPLGVRCLLITEVDNGIATLMWPHDARRSWTSPVLNGDARRSSVR